MAASRPPVRHVAQEPPGAVAEHQAVAFRLADEEGLPLLDLKDLQAMLVFIGENANTISTRYGLVSTSSIGAIQRRLLLGAARRRRALGSGGRLGCIP